MATLAIKATYMNGRITVSRQRNAILEPDPEVGLGMFVGLFRSVELLLRETYPNLDDQTIANIRQGVFDHIYTDT